MAGILRGFFAGMFAGIPAGIYPAESGGETLGPELIDATVDFSDDTGWAYGARFTGFAGAVDYDESNPDTGPLTAPFVAPLSAGNHRVTFELTATNGEYLTAMADATMIGAHNVASVYSTVYAAAGGESAIVLTPTSELDPSTGTITSISVRRIL